MALAGNVVIEGVHGILLARLRDLSLHGMYITSGAVRLALHAPLQLRFSLDRARQREHFCIEAMVVRATGEGAGLMFLDPELATQRALREVLYATAPAPRTTVGMIYEDAPAL